MPEPSPNDLLREQMRRAREERQRIVARSQDTTPKSKVGGIQRTGPTDEDERPGLHDGRPALRTLRLKDHPDFNTNTED